MNQNRLAVSARAGAAVVLATILSGALAAQDGRSIATRVHDAPNGTVRFTYRARPNVCGSGNSVYTDDGASRNSWGQKSSADVQWDSDCVAGPVRVVLNVRDHAVTDLRSYVGGRWRTVTGVTDLGEVTPRAASDYLLQVAKAGPPDVAKKAIFPATLADSVVIWPQLIAIARSAAVSLGVRRDAVFWLGQMAGASVTANLADLAAADTVDRAVRESAVFALSQQHNGDGVPALIHIAQTNRDPSVRKRALFWLGQSNDPRALTLFEQILTGSGKSPGK